MAGGRGFWIVVFGKGVETSKGKGSGRKPKKTQSGWKKCGLIGKHLARVGEKKKKFASGPRSDKHRGTCKNF